MSLDFNNQFVGTDWHPFIQDQAKRMYWSDLLNHVENAYTTNLCFPPKALLLRAFLTTPLHKIKIVILGQDPYHQPGQAHGLSFSVPSTCPIPPSLRNVLKELQRDPLVHPPLSNDLTDWAKQGVFLLNTWLSVRANEAGSHRNFGWEKFTDACIEHVSKECSHVVFMLWGAAAQKKANLIDPSKHCVLEAPHPSPLSAHRGFIGCGHFSKANAWLKGKGVPAIDWSNGNAL
jgi:uracil-DNA glycosylase